MRKPNLILTLLVLSALLLAACGGTAEGTVAPGVEGTEGLPGLGGETAEPLPDTGAEATETLEVTEEVMESPTVAATEAVTEAATEAVTTEAGATSAAPSMPGATLLPNPSSMANLLDYEVQNANGDVLADVDNMVIDLSSSHIQHVILASGGFLGIGETLIPVPWNVLSLNPECTTAAAGAAGTPVGTELAATEPAVTEPAATDTMGLAATETPGTGPAETGEIPGEGVQCFFLLNADDEMLRNAPIFEPDQLPDVSTPGWDAEFNDYWSGAGAATGTGTEEPAATETPGSDDTGTAAGTATPAAGGTDQTEVTGVDLILADELLSMDVVAGAGGGQVSGGGETGAPAETAAPGTEATDTTGATGGTDDTNIGQATGTDEVLGTVTDAIVEMETGQVRYLLVSAEPALGDDAVGMLIPVPAQAAAVTGEEGARMLSLNVDRDTLAGAPSFDPTTFPDTSTEGWDADIQTYWSDFVTIPAE